MRLKDKGLEAAKAELQETIDRILKNHGVYVMATLVAQTHTEDSVASRSTGCVPDDAIMQMDTDALIALLEVHASVALGGTLVGRDESLWPLTVTRVYSMTLEKMQGVTRRLDG